MSDANPIRYETDAEGIVTLTFDAPGAPVNTLTQAWTNAMTEAVDRVLAEKDKITGVILASAKKTFFAGAELKDVLKLTEADGPRWYNEIQQTKRDFRRLETCGRPVVAAVAGAALGGGWELALAAHCRIALDEAKILLGLPEVTLGLLPGAGGVTKLVRILGLEVALPILMEGKTMSPRQMHELGLVQDLAATPEEMFAKARAWIKDNPNAQQPWDVKGYRLPGGSPDSPKIAQMLSIAPAVTAEKTRGLLPAPEAIMACAVEHRHAGGEPLPDQAGGGQGGQEPDHPVLQPDRDPRRRLAPQGRAEVEGHQGRHSRRGHDGLGHRLGQRQPRRGVCAQGRIDGSSRKGQELLGQAARKTDPARAHGRNPCRYHPVPHHPHRIE